LLLLGFPDDAHAAVSNDLNEPIASNGVARFLQRTVVRRKGEHDCLRLLVLRRQSLRSGQVLPVRLVHLWCGDNHTPVMHSLKKSMVRQMAPRAKTLSSHVWQV